MSKENKTINVIRCASQVVGNQICLFNKGVESSKMKIEKT